MRNINSCFSDSLDGNRNSAAFAAPDSSRKSSSAAPSAASTGPPQLTSPTDSVASADGVGATWHGIIPKVRRKYIDVVEGVFWVSWPTITTLVFQQKKH